MESFTVTGFRFRKGRLVPRAMRVLSLLALTAFAMFSQTIADDFRTTTGREYKNATVRRIEPDGIVIAFPAGIVKISFVELPKELQEKYNYDPQAGQKFASEIHDNLKAIRFARLGVSQTITEAAYGNAVASELGATEAEHGREYHVGNFVIRVSFSNGLSAMQLFEKADKSEITKAEMEGILEANGPLSEWIGPSTSTNGGFGYGNKNRQLLFAYRSESHDALLATVKYFKDTESRDDKDQMQTQVVDSSGSGLQEAPSAPHAGIPETPREAADAYIESLKQAGIVFASEFRRMMAYPHLSPPTTEVIYVLDYRTQAGVRLVAPYTITVKQSGGGWAAIGGTPGDRTADLNTDPVIDGAGFRHRSPMEQFMGDAMGRAMKKRP